MSDIGPFDIGDEIILRADFKDENGAAADPSDVTLRILDPAGVETTVGLASLDHPLAGRYEHRLVIDQADLWHYRFVGVGGVTQAEERSFRVRQSVFA